MARDEAPPFPRGSTLNGYGATIDPNNLGGGNLLGKEWRHEDTIYGTGQMITIRAVRNTGGFTLLPSRLCQFDPAYPGTSINGYVATSNGPGVLLDELLTNGLPANDIGYVVMEGPALALAPLDGGADNVMNFMDPLTGITAATSGATTAGRVATAGTSGQTINARDALLNLVGRAMSAKTTGNTGAGVLVNVKRLF